jgi:hypothetical protein
MKPVPDEISEYMAKIGAKGGKKGRGAKKKRPASHYKKLGDIHRKRKAAEKAARRDRE